MKAHISLGRRGEEAAVDYLTGLGWTVVERNWRCDDGEIDIVAHDGRGHVVCEVKTRGSSRFGDPLEAITPDKAARLHRLARRWAAARGVTGSRLRVDVLGLVRDGDGFSVDHLREVC
ncbi:MAG TPA: YraN family protein [Spirillospora sp.]